MSPPRAPRGGGTNSGRSTTPSGLRGRGTGRSSTPTPSRGGRGRASGGAPETNPKAEGLLQGLQNGSLNKKSTPQRGSSEGGRGKKLPPLLQHVLENNTTKKSQAQLTATTQPVRRSAGLPVKGRSSAPRGSSQPIRGRANPTNAPITQFTRPSSTAGDEAYSQKEYMDQQNARYKILKPRREGERAKAIRDGFLADPEKKTNLDKAITPVGTCTDMCPEFERVERIVQNYLDRQEKTFNEAWGKDKPDEQKMVKRFRRSAAGYDEQLPSDIRTPATLQRTLNYLLDNVIAGGERLAITHKFVWDRTRGIRNDFSIQQVTREDDVKIAVDCFERIARFHILCLHQLSDPENLLDGENFDAYQEREQLNNTLLSLMYYYDDNRGKQIFPNEAEFRAYCIIFELQSQHPDLEDRMQSWPQQLLDDKRIQSAFRLYSSAANTLFDQGPLKPTTPFAIAQGNAGSFWAVLRSKAISYLMACVAEIYFGQVRYLALQNLWDAHKGPPSQQARSQEWTVSELTSALAFDYEEETLEFCSGYDLGFKTDESGVQYLDFTSRASALDQSCTPRTQVFSHGIVEAKRYRRTLVAVINGIGVARAIREGLVEADDSHIDDSANTMEDDSSEALFFAENANKQTAEAKLTSAFNPQAPSFSPFKTSTQTAQPLSTGSFGQPSSFSPFAASTTTSSSTPVFSWSPSVRPTNTTTAPSGFGLPSVSASKPVTQAPISPFTTSTTLSAAPISSPFGGFNFEGLASNFSRPTTTNAPSPFGQPPATSATSTPSFSFGQPSTTPSFFAQPSPLQPEAKEQPSETGKNDDAPLFSSAFPPSMSSPSSTTSFPQVGVPSGPASPGQVDRPQPQPPVSQRSASQNNPESALGPSFTPRLGAPSSENGAERLSSFAPLSQFQPPNTGSGRASAQPSPSFTFQPQTIDSGATTPTLTQSFQPGQPPPSPSTLRPVQPSPISGPRTPVFNWKLPTPSTSTEKTKTTAITSTSGPSTSFSPLPPRFPTLPPRNLPPPSEQLPKIQKSFPSNHTKPRTSSPLSTPPITFGDDANPFRQSAALAEEPPSPKSTLSASDRDAASETLCQLAFLQPGGLISNYLEYMLPGLLKPMMQQHEQEKPVFGARAARIQLLARKYFRRWKLNTYRRASNRRARDRRQKKLDAIRKENEKRMRSENELLAILEAKQEKERIQAEMSARGSRESSPRIGAPLFPLVNDCQRKAGKKRKSIHVDLAENLANRDAPRKVAKGHRRSRTAGHAGDFSAQSNGSSQSVPTQSNSSVFSGRFILSPSRSQGLRRSLSGRKDTTRTDYFRLKALGIDPETPMVPETKASLERKRQREGEAVYTGKQRVRPLSSPARPSVPQFSTTSETRNGTSAPSYSWQQSRSVTQTAAPAAPAKVGDHDEDDDDFLRQIREVRATMSADAEWFKTQATQIEKEVQEQEEELRRSASRASSKELHNASVKGLTQVNGYEYLPSQSTSMNGLSRTEQRIRRTGAHGLATKPIGGTKDYLAVAMSKQSARAQGGISQPHSPHVAGHAAEKKPKGKRKMGEKDSRYVPRQPDEESEEEGEGANSLFESQPVLALNQTNHHLQPNEVVEEEDEHNDDDQEQDDDVQESLEYPPYEVVNSYGDANGMDSGDTDEFYEGGDDEDEDGEAQEEDLEPEEDDEVGELPRHVQQTPKQGGYWLRSSATPEPADKLSPNTGGREMSRASSGMGTATGASADDAYVLDSD